MQSSVRSLLNGKITFENLDLVYAAGLYDYLKLSTAKRLTRIMFEMLKPGGRLLVANFMPNLRDIGYMETFMQWYLIYRDAEEFEQVAGEIPSEAIATQRTFLDEPGNIVFLEITKG